MDDYTDIATKPINGTDKPSIGLSFNYSFLIGQLEEMALRKFANRSVELAEFDMDSREVSTGFFGTPIAAARAPPPSHGMSDVEYSRVVSDIWIGVILTLLVISVVFFICSCFLYHKFQEWKNSCKFLFL